MEQQLRLAVLIDADNAHFTIIESLLTEVAKYGTANVKRIYGDWTQPELRGWKEVLLRHSVQPIQQFRYTTGKNATDSAMIIDAMDLLYTGRFDGFCLVSSDSDFTKLASRLRESGLIVYGFGERKTPEPFVVACDRFFYYDILTKSDDDGSPRRNMQDLKRDTRLKKMVTTAVESASDDTGWAQLGHVGSNLAKQAPEFDPRNYGYKKLADLVADLGLFEIEEEVSPDGRSRVIWVSRAKPTPKP